MLVTILWAVAGAGTDWHGFVIRGWHRLAKPTDVTQSQEVSGEF